VFFGIDSGKCNYYLDNLCNLTPVLSEGEGAASLILYRVVVSVLVPLSFGEGLGVRYSQVIHHLPTLHLRVQDFE